MNFFEKLKTVFSAPAQPEQQKQVAALDTRHGAVNVTRMEIANAVAYVCHTSQKPEDAILDLQRVAFMATDRNQGEDYEEGTIMSEDSDWGKGDYAYAAERACNSTALMDKAVVVVFFDHINDQNGTASNVLKTIRTQFPATNPSLDCLESPPERTKPRLQLVKPAKPETPKDFHYSC